MKRKQFQKKTFSEKIFKLRAKFSSYQKNYYFTQIFLKKIFNIFVSVSFLLSIPFFTNETKKNQEYELHNDCIVSNLR